jgi:hypothetical protein
MALKDFDHDIPVTLVKQYKASDKAYVDEGFASVFWGLLNNDAHVSKVSNGFQGYEDELMLFGLLAHDVEQAEFDDNGQLGERSYKSSLLTGLLLSGTGEQVRKDGKMLKGYGRSILWGAFGYDKDTSGQLTVQFLWIDL